MVIATISKNQRCFQNLLLLFDQLLSERNISCHHKGGVQHCFFVYQSFLSRFQDRHNVRVGVVFNPLFWQSQKRDGAMYNGLNRFHINKTTGDSHHPYRVGLFIPMSGDAGIWGVSCRVCAELAVHELNNSGGINNREVVLRLEDASSIATEDIADKAEFMVSSNQIDAIVGMHTSDVRTRIENADTRNVPYIYTPLWEGGYADKGTTCIGETPQQQLLPAMDWMIERYNLRTWVFIGHDYVWPMKTHALARDILKKQKLTLLKERYLSFDMTDFSLILDDLKQLKPDAVLVSLVGQGNVEFNRQFAAEGLDQSILRLSTALEENMLLSIGARNTSGLFSSAGYFAHIKSSRNDGFLERYHNHFGDLAPPVGSIGHSLYEGLYILRDRIIAEASDDISRHPMKLAGARQGDFINNHHTSLQEVYLAEVKGLNFETAHCFTTHR